MSNPKSQIIKSLQNIVGEVDIKLDIPEREEFGDYSSNVAMTTFENVKTQTPNAKWKTARDYGEHIKSKLDQDDQLAQYVDTIEIVGPGFINFHLARSHLTRVLKEILEKGENFGKSKIGNGKTVVIDYSSPNIAKPFGIGHLRSTIIGQALYNIYTFLDYNVVGDNHLGDWGTQFGKLLYMLDVTFKGESLQGITLEDLEKLYVQFHQEAENDPKLEETARVWFKKLEDGDSTARSLWQKCVDISMAEFNRIYKLLGVEIDYAYGESSYEEEMKKMVDDFNSGKLKGLEEGEDGAKIVNLEGSGINVPLMFLKADGATTYATRDLACIRFRVREWNPDIFIYEVGVEQKLHFQQVFAAAKQLGLVNKRVILYHTNHGWYLAPDGKKFSTREGKTVKLEEILREAVERAKKLGSEDEDTARKVGIGAIKYYDLMRSVQTDVVFSWDKIMNMEGNSGPYLQYTYARTRSVLAKSIYKKTNTKSQTKSNDKNSDVSNLENWDLNVVSDFEFDISNLNKEELSLLRSFIHFPEVVETAAENYAPNLLCNYLFDLAQKFNTFYQKHKIIGGLEVRHTGSGTQLKYLNKGSSPGVYGTRSVESFRLSLTLATGTIIKSGLELLGIDSPEKM